MRKEAGAEYPTGKVGHDIKHTKKEKNQITWVLSAAVETLACF
jgi:hypothetical protein